MINTNIGKRLRTLRDSKKLTRKEVSQDLQIPENTYRNYETGVSEPSTLMLIKLASYYQVTVDWILGIVISDESKTPPPSEEWIIMKKQIEQLSQDDQKELHSFLDFLISRDKNA